jgi:hypothetical protein
MKRHPRRDPVTPETYRLVMERDQGCVAPRLDRTAGLYRGALTLDHVKDAPRMGQRAPSDPGHLVTVCAWHHMETGWATSHRPELRKYLATQGDPTP